MRKMIRIAGALMLAAVGVSGGQAWAGKMMDDKALIASAMSAAPAGVGRGQR